MDSLSRLKLAHIVVFVTTLLLMGGAVYSWIMLQPEFDVIHEQRLQSFWGLGTIMFSVILLTIKMIFFIFLLKKFLDYKAIASVTDSLLPTCTIIVPAYNEGKLVWETLHSIASSDYPSEKLQILAIDDGSKDNTWEWIQRAKSELGNRITIFKQPKNMGKRQALYKGFNLGTGEIFVTIDSDSIIEKDTLRNLVSPFVANEQCGAVAGNVRVLNNQGSIIPKMLNVSFVFSFEFVRSAQSAIGTVLCTPGALSAYRREAVLNCLPDWINQTFMGQPSDIGEDRAMTNMILKQGYDVQFQKNAIVYTNVPENYKTLYNMFTRWERSNVRENIMMSQFAFTNFRNEGKLGARILLLNQWINVITAIPTVVLMVLFLVLQPAFFLSTALVSMLLFSSIQFFFYARKYSFVESFWAYPYSIFYSFCLFWITPYAIFTAHRRGWLTRELKAA
jgi:hyaluronan synthase